MLFMVNVGKYTIHGVYGKDLLVHGSLGFVGSKHVFTDESILIHIHHRNTHQSYSTGRGLDS